MADEAEFEALKGRIVELENQLKTQQVRRGVKDLSPEDLQAYARVRDVIAADYGEFCGINDCFRCISRCTVCAVCVVRCLEVCIHECTCGPCNVGGLGSIGNAAGRFGGLGY
ncbi:hypothetical protein [Georgenia satyanarayanai]|uniref:hypothetical protein n=1 Tax=Georgenia satyanarayanai TaxID=860221 RepID=UPI0012659F4E|nr:hypothetical protein [Georgenia satyanarayanai]